MLKRAVLLSVFVSSCLFAAAAVPQDGVPNMTTPPRAGKVDLFPEGDLKPGMQGVAWTVFQGSKPEPMPVEIIGIWENAWGPKQDIIVAKLTGKAERTNVAGGMSGSPVYIDGKLVGAISLRLSVFSPDAICGITPIKLMLDVQEFDQSRPIDRRTPDKVQLADTSAMPSGLLARVMAAGSSGNLAEPSTMAPIATPITMSGFSDSAIKEFAPIFNQLGMAVTPGVAAANSIPRSPLRIGPLRCSPATALPRYWFQAI